MSKKERGTKEETQLPPARSARVFLFFPSFEAANHCLFVLVSARSRLQARVIDALYTQASVRREASRERCRESEQSIEEGGRKREREPPGILFCSFSFRRTSKLRRVPHALGGESVDWKVCGSQRGGESERWR